MWRMRMMKKVSRDKLLQLFCKDGISVKEISKILDMNSSTLYKELKVCGITINPCPSKMMTDEIEEEIVRLYSKDKKTQNEILELLPIKYSSTDSIGKVLRRRGIPKNKIKKSRKTSADRKS